MSTIDVAKAIVNEVPLSQLNALVGKGQELCCDGAGGNCGGGFSCSNGGCGCMVIDPNGHTGLTNDDIRAAFSDKAALSKAIVSQIKGVAAQL